MKLVITEPDDDDAQERWRVLKPVDELRVKLIVSGLEGAKPELTKVDVEGRNVSLEGKDVRFHAREKGFFAVVTLTAAERRSTDFQRSVTSRIVSYEVTARVTPDVALGAPPDVPAGAEMARAKVLVVPQLQVQLAAVVTTMTAGLLVLGAFGLARDQTAWELVVRASGSGIATLALAAILPRFNPFKLPLAGIPQRLRYAVVALVVASVGVIVLPAAALVRIYNRTDHAFELPRGETTALSVPKRGWVTVFAFDSAIDRGALTGWLASPELKSSGLEPCFFWDSPLKSPLESKCEREYKKDWQATFFWSQFGIDCKARHFDVDPEATTAKTAKTCSKRTTEGKCRIEIGTAGCKLVDADHDFRGAWIFAERSAATFCPGTDGLEDAAVTVRLPFDDVRKRGAVTTPRRICVHEPKDVGVFWAREKGIDGGGPGYLSLKSPPSTLATKLVSLPLDEHAEGFVISLRNGQDKDLGSLRCDGLRQDRCSGVQRIVAKNVRIQSLVASQPNLRSSYTSSSQDLPDRDGWACFAPTGGCGGKAGYESATGAELTLSELGVDEPAIEFPLDMTPKVLTILDQGKKLGVLTCEAKRNKKIVVERIRITVPAAGDETVGVGTLEANGWRSAWAPARESDAKPTVTRGNTSAWICHEKADTSRTPDVAVHVGPIKAKLDWTKRSMALLTV